MTPYLIFFLVSFAALAYGTYTDFRERIVSNRVTYGLLAFGLAGHAVLAVIEANAMVFAESLAVALATFASAYVLYRLGVWAGGDVKLFTGLAAINPVNPGILARLGIASLPFLQPIDLPVFPLTLFMFSLFSMLPYGAALAAARLLKNKAEKEKFKEDFKKRLLQGLELSAMAVGLSTALSFVNVTQWALLPLLFASAFLPGKAKPAVSGILLLFALWLNAEQAAWQFLGLLAFMLGFYLLLKLYRLSKILMRKPVRVSELEEGMISAQTLVMKGNKVETVPELGIKKLIKYFASNRSGKAMELLQPKGKVIVSSRAAGGLTAREITELKRLSSAKKIGKEFMVKESAPFVPAVLIAYIALNIVGDVIWFWLL